MKNASLGTPGGPVRAGAALAKKVHARRRGARGSGKRTSRPVSRILYAERRPSAWRPSIWACRHRQTQAVYPQVSDGPPSNTCADAEGALLTLLRVGFTEPPLSPGVLVVSYTTLSPLPGRIGRAVCFLWHFPEGHPWLPLATTLPCGVRTFLDGRAPPRPPGRLVRSPSLEHATHRPHSPPRETGIPAFRTLPRPRRARFAVPAARVAAATRARGITPGARCR
ncbi:hypothetical protein SAMN04489718_1965 [Actinopolyspora saharensis]|uniref:Uncharacterized protein n=1 Tax=Actinopolyspora saharensis TaxID=995062 RepID=A0A1H1DA43_9ACTN|nr:hypothetical protein SAMN04489718_1965 [Actinopolyspora saharensis]